MVADASAIFRTGLRAVLERDGSFEVREASSLEELFELAAAEPLDLAIVDLDLPPEGGVTAVERLAQATRSPRIAVWSFEPSSEDVLAAVSAGALGFLCKATSQSELLGALRRVLVGEAALAPDIAGLLVSAVQAARRQQEARAAQLSARERRVLELVSGGLRNREIGAALGISEFTVKRHVQNILRKLDLPSRRAAAAFHAGASGLRREEAAA